jgi:hypothetical protein
MVAPPTVKWWRTFQAKGIAFTIYHHVPASGLLKTG